MPKLEHFGSKYFDEVLTELFLSSTIDFLMRVEDGKLEFLEPNMNILPKSHVWQKLLCTWLSFQNDTKRFSKPEKNAKNKRLPVNPSS